MPITYFNTKDLKRKKLCILNYNVVWLLVLLWLPGLSGLLVILKIIDIMDNIDIMDIMDVMEIFDNMDIIDTMDILEFMKYMNMLILLDILNTFELFDIIDILILNNRKFINNRDFNIFLKQYVHHKNYSTNKYIFFNLTHNCLPLCIYSLLIVSRWTLGCSSSVQ